MSSVFFGLSTRTYHYERTVGRFEFAGTGFRQPVDMALAPDGTIYVVNRCWEHRPDGVRVTMLTLDEELIGQFSRFGEADGELFWPTSIALDSHQNVYVTDDWLNRVSVFDKEGNFLHKWGVPGSGDGNISKPSGIRFDRDDNAYVVDSANHRVQVFTSDGRYLHQWGEQGSAEGQFNLPWGLAIDSEGCVYVADWRNDRIQKFTREGEFLAAFGSSGSGIGELNRPTAVAVDKDGDIYVADWFNDRVQVYTPDGRLITTFTGDASMSKWGQEKLNANPDMIRQRKMLRDFSDEKHLWRPKAVLIDPEGHVIILDAYRARLQVYQKDNY